MEIYCLFSIDNEYNQPSNNLEAWFKEKPSIENLFKYFGINISDDDAVSSVVRVWNLGEARINGADYRLELVKEGVLK